MHIYLVSLTKTLKALIEQEELFILDCGRAVGIRSHRDLPAKAVAAKRHKVNVRCIVCTSEEWMCEKEHWSIAKIVKV